MSPAQQMQQMIAGLELFVAVVGALSVVVTAGAVWAVQQATLKRTVREVASVKQVVGLEVRPDGKLQAAFPTHDECGIRERRSDARLAAAEEEIKDHGHRITILEARGTSR